MCGITGFFSRTNLINTSKFYESHLLIKHRGPDDEGFFAIQNNEKNFFKGDDTIAEIDELSHITSASPATLLFGHRRLSIIDLSQNGHQPYSFDGLYLTYNGEIYNYIELRKELIEIGYEFNTSSDTEVFLKAFHHWGEEAFNKFNGMWAAAIYRESTDEVILTRDRFGIKPLYYYLNEGNLYFSSEIRFILPFIKNITVNESSVYAYLRYCYSNHSDETFFSDIKILLPGHTLVTNSINFEIKKYFKLTPSPNSNPEDAFKKSLKLRIRSDVELGALLSGGIDSSAIVGKLWENNSNNNLKTFSAVLENRDEDTEIEYIDSTVKKLKIHNEKILLKPDLNRLDELINVIEQPLRQFSEFGLYSIYEHIHKNTNIKVLLNGDGADEIFSGYLEQSYSFIIWKFKNLQLLSFVSEFIFLKNRLGIGVISLSKRLLNTFLHKSSIVRYFKWNKHDVFKVKNTLYRKKFSNNYFRNELHFTLQFSALNEYLLYTDKTSMNYSLEARVPFLDHNLVQAAYGLHEDQLIQKGTTKLYLKNMIRGSVPDDVIDRKDKKGFYVPLERWIRGDLREKMTKEFLQIKEEGLFSFLDNDAIYQSFDDYLNHKHNDHSFIWRIYCLKRWKESFNVSE